MSTHYNTTITYYPGYIQVKYYPEFSPSLSVCDDEGVKESPESIAYRSLNRTKKYVFDYARCNEFDYFVTLTFNPQLVDSFDYVESSKAMSYWLDRIRRRCPDLKYIGVPELHKSKRFHFHFLMSGIDGLDIIDSGHRDKFGHIIYNFKKSTYHLGWTELLKIYEQGDKLAQYLSKYITKDLANMSKNRKRYWNSRNLILPASEVCYMDLNDIKMKFSGLEVKFSKTVEEGHGCGMVEFFI